MSNWNKKQLEAQFNRAVKNGWLKHFEEAAATMTKGYFDTADLLAIGSRESNLDPKWLTKAGDHGNGFGLMQADKRSFPQFTKGDGWKDARTGILFGGKVLMQKWADYENNIGKNLTVKSSKGGIYKYKAEKAEGIDEQRLVISSYNCGRWSQYCLATNQDLDKYSTGKDYGADVMRRAAVFRALLINSKIDAVPSASKLKEQAPDVEQTPVGTTNNLVEPRQQISADSATTGQVSEVQASGSILESADSLLDSLTEKAESSIGEVRETVTETVQKGEKQVEKTTTEVKDTFSPANIPAFIPQFGWKQWALGLIPGGGFVATISSKLTEMPDWFVLLLGVITGIALYAFFQFAMKHREKVLEFITEAYRITADPTKHNLIPTPAARFVGKRRDEIKNALEAN